MLEILLQNANRTGVLQTMTVGDVNGAVTEGQTKIIKVHNDIIVLSPGSSS